MIQASQPPTLRNKIIESHTKFRRLSLRDVVIERMKQAVINGELVDGQKITELELAEWLDVSRGLVREVIRELENSGILINIPYKGTFVRSLTAERVNELYTLRSRLEEFAVELAIKNATDADISALYEIIASMKRYSLVNDANKFVEVDLEFHKALYAMSQHQLLIDNLERLSGQTHLFIQASKVIYSLFSSLEDAANSHLPIVKAMEKRDVSLARKEISQHICEVGERLVDILREKEMLENNLREVNPSLLIDPSIFPPTHPLF